MPGNNTSRSLESAAMATRGSKQQEETVSIILKSLLESKELRSLIHSAITEAIQSSLEKLSNTIDHHEGRIHDLECQLDKSSAEIGALNQANEKFKCDIAQLTAELNVLEQYSRRNCLRVFGIGEQSNKDTDTLIMKLTSEKLGVDLSTSDIDRSHRIGRPDSKGNRPIIVKFTNYSARSSVIKARRKLKSTGIVIQEDLTARNRELLKQTSAHPKVSSAWSLDGRIFGLVTSQGGVESKKRIFGPDDLSKL